MVEEVMNTDSEGQFQFSGALLRKIFDSLSAHIVIIDEHGVILETNSAWKNFSTANGLPGNIDFNGMNYLSVCDAATNDGIQDARAVASGIRQVVKREINEFLYDYPCHSPEGPIWFYMRAVLMAEESPLRVIISHDDITQLKLVQKTLKENQVASLVKDGKTTSEIADILFVSKTTISFHRKNLRDKLGLKNRGANLRSFLLSMT